MKYLMKKNNFYLVEKFIKMRHRKKKNFYLFH